MTTPSKYELAAWLELQQPRERTATRAVHAIGDRTVRGAQAISGATTRALESRPALRGARDAVVKAARKGGAAIPDAAVDAARTAMGEAVAAVETTVASVARVGLTPAAMVKKHQRKGHDVTTLVDVRALDLEQVDAVRGSTWRLTYPALAASSGGAANIVITGGALSIPVTAGVAAAPGGAAITGAIAFDAATLLTLASRAVGQVALSYGYDPDKPSEKLFTFGIVNAGTATTSAGKYAAMAELSFLTQNLVRNASWEVLNKSVIARLAGQLYARFTVRLTKVGLGKIVPGLGIVLGASFNWATIEALVDSADDAYRRRFLIEKYPELEGDVHTGSGGGASAGSADAVEEDDTISVLGELAAAGGPDLRESTSDVVDAEVVEDDPDDEPDQAAS